MGGKPSDFIWTTLAIPKLVSDRVVGLLRAEDVTGWSLYPVRVVGKNGLEIQGFHGLAVVGRCGPFDGSKSQMIIKPPPVPRGRPAPYRKGLYFDPVTWDGSDVFCSEDGSGTVVVTRRVHELFRRHKVTNVYLESLVDVERRA
jgi:hypothetical protein